MNFVQGAYIKTDNGHRGRVVRVYPEMRQDEGTEYGIVFKDTCNCSRWPGRRLAPDPYGERDVWIAEQMAEALAINTYQAAQHSAAAYQNKENGNE